MKTIIIDNRCSNETSFSCIPIGIFFFYVNVLFIKISEGEAFNFLREEKEDFSGIKGYLVCPVEVQLSITKDLIFD